MSDERFQIPALTGARFVAAVSVVLAHACAMMQFENSHFTDVLQAPFAIFGMSLFFVLSGFVIYLNYFRLFESSALAPALYDFAVARFARIVPLYAALYLLVLAITPWDVVGAMLPQMLVFLIILQAWVPANGNELLTLSVPQLSHTWSISAEFFFYACFPLIALALASVKRPIRAALVLVPAAYLLLYGLYRMRHPLLSAIAGDLKLDAAVFWLAYLCPAPRIFEFILGCLAARWFVLAGERPVTPTEQRVAGWGAAICGLCLGAILTVALFHRRGLAIDNFTQFVGVNIAGAPFVAYLLAFVSRYRSGLQRVLSHRFFVLGGEMSYSIYMLHLFLLIAFKQAHPELTWILGAEAIFRVVVGTSVVLILAWGSFVFIEAPARKWLRARLARPDAAAVTAPYRVRTPAGP